MFSLTGYASNAPDDFDCLLIFISTSDGLLNDRQARGAWPTPVLGSQNPPLRPVARSRSQSDVARKRRC